MVVQEHLEDGLVRTYSNAGFKVHGGSPEGDYDIVYDPEDTNRQYVETNIPVDTPIKIAEVSKRKFYNSLAEVEVWSQIETFLKENELWNDFLFAKPTLALNDSLITSISAELKTNLEFTDEQVTQLISESLD